MKANFLVLSIFVFGLVASSCGGWTTRYSGKYDEINTIHINLDKEGKWTLGPCGPGREILEAYEFDFQPIRRIYTDSEIKLTQRDPDTLFVPIDPVKGSVSFNEDYSKVTIEIQIPIDGNMVAFPGNGTYRVNEDH